MKWKAMTLLTVTAWLAGPAALSACETSLNHRFWNTMRGSLAIGAGVQIQPGSDGEETFMIFTGDLGIPVGERALIAPAVGLCRAGGDADFSEILFGAAGAVNIFNNQAGSLSLNLQAAVTRVSYESGSELNFPIALAGAARAGNALDVIFGGGMIGVRDSFEFGDVSDSETDFDPYGFGGVSLGAGQLTLQGSVTARMGEDFEGESEIDLAFNIAVAIPVGD
jgi:hypothetical protein